jgi:excisionase family DNA binding protein
MTNPINNEIEESTTVGHSAPFLENENQSPHQDENGAALLISIEEAASILGIGRTLTFELIMQGKVSSVKIGRRRLVVRQELDEFVRELSISQNSNHFAEHYLS